MRYTIQILVCLLVLLASCQLKKKSNASTGKANSNCQSGLMKRASNMYGIDEAIPPIENLESQFMIVVDSTQKTVNFVSWDENFLREQAATLDTFDFMSVDEEWNRLTLRQKLEQVSQNRSLRKRQADSVHIANNQGQQRVWLINNTNDTVQIQLQDWSYICILEAVTTDGAWSPIQYWRFSDCGNSYADKHFLPKTANSFLMEWPRQGDYATRLRFKLLGVNRFYYSNEFAGRINYCEFVEPTQKAKKTSYKYEARYKLDSLLHLAAF